MNGPVQLAPGKSGVHCARNLGFAPRASVKTDPALIDEQLNRPVLGLVTHLAAVLDPVAQIDRKQSQTRRFGNLPEDGKAPEAAPFLAWLVKGVNRRQPIGQYIGYGNCQ